MSSSKVNMIQGHYNIYISRMYVEEHSIQVSKKIKKKKGERFCLYVTKGALNLSVLALKFCVIARHFRVRMRDTQNQHFNRFLFFFFRGEKVRRGEN